MAKLTPVSSPQFRTQLIRKFRNLVPSCTLEFVDGVSPGLGFRLRDKQGRLRSNIIRIYRNGPGVLSSEHLINAARNAGIPNAGLAKGL